MLKRDVLASDEECLKRKVSGGSLVDMSVNDGHTSTTPYPHLLKTNATRAFKKYLSHMFKFFFFCNINVFFMFFSLVR